jgi:hypothetical protein
MDSAVSVHSAAYIGRIQGYGGLKKVNRRRGEVRRCHYVKRCRFRLVASQNTTILVRSEFGVACRRPKDLVILHEPTPTLLDEVFPTLFRLLTSATGYEQ